jgi:CMP-N-acetylneuraminic acid synthetase
MKIITVIPARGGSKGILGKNIYPLSGKPLLAHSIESALKVERIDRLVVSTDDKAIAEIATQYGAEVVVRPEDISGDTASSELALLHVLETLLLKEGYHPDLLVFLQCTCPLTLPEDIDGAVKLLLDQQADTAFAVTRSHYILWKKDTYGNFIGINHDKNKRLMRQQCEEQFVETGAIYVMRVDGFLAAKNRFFGKTVGYELPRERFCDIDTPMDFFLAEQMMIWQKDRNKKAI